MVEIEQATCKRCSKPIELKDIGPYKREYCSDSCRQKAYRERERERRIEAVNRNATMERVTQLEQELAKYRQIVDLSDHQGMVAQFMLTGEEIGYKALSSVDVRPGPHAWYAFSQTADDEHLGAGIVAARRVYKQLADLQTTTEVAQLNKLITDLKLERNVLRQQLEECNHQQSTGGR